MLRVLLLALTLGDVKSGLSAEWEYFGWREECRDAAVWTRQPGWLGNASPTAAAKNEAESICFRVDEPGRGMKWSLATPAIMLDETPWLVVRYRAENMDTHGTDYFLYVNDHLPGRQLSPLRLRNVASDGHWHLVAVDLSTLTEAESVDGIAVQVQSGAAGNAAVWLDWLGLCPSPPDDAEVSAARRTDSASARLDRPTGCSQWIAPDHVGWPTRSGEQLPTGTAARRDRVSRPPDGPRDEMVVESARTRAADRPSLRFATLPGRWGRNAKRLRACACWAQPHGRAISGYAPAIGAEELLADGRWHTLDVDVRRLAAKYPTITGFAIQLQAAVPDAVLELAELRLVNQRQPARLADGLHWTAGAEFKKHAAVPMTQRLTPRPRLGDSNCD